MLPDHAPVHVLSYISCRVTNSLIYSLRGRFSGVSSMAADFAGGRWFRDGQEEAFQGLEKGNGEAGENRGQL
jgi:hypothetical protein